MLKNKLRSIITPWRLKWYPRMLLFALLVAFVIAVFMGKGATTLTGSLGGDYPAFYGAGRIVADGDSKDLYKPEKQLQSQKGLLPGETGFLPFAYPPFVALAYCPLSWLNYRISYALHTLLMAGALILALWLCRPFSKQLRDYFLPATCLSLWFYPIFRAVTGGQNSTLSLLLIVLSLRAILAGRDWLAGIILGCLLFKPQFAVPLIGLNVLSRRFSVAGWSGVTALVLYSVGAMVSGPDWINNWLKFGWWFSEIDSGINYANSISWLGFFVAIFGHHSHSAMIMGWIMTFATAGCLCLIWGVMGRHVDIAAGWAFAVAGLPLLLPHAMYYEAGILLVPYFILLAEVKDKSLIYGLTFWALGFTQLLSAFIGFSPLFLLCLAVFILALYTLSQVVLSDRANKDNTSLNGIASDRGKLNTIITEGSRKSKVWL